VTNTALSLFSLSLSLYLSISPKLIALQQNQPLTSLSLQWFPSCLSNMLLSSLTFKTTMKARTVTSKMESICTDLKERLSLAEAKASRTGAALDNVLTQVAFDYHTRPPSLYLINQTLLYATFILYLHPETY
jgi:hypothetical protein